MFSALEIVSYSQKSAVWDEPIHIADGYASLVQHDFRVDPEHPPLLRLWAALPLLGLGVSRFDVAAIDRVIPGVWARTLFSYCERFLYGDNDGDRLLYPARFMILLLGVGLGVLVFLWAREWLGFWPAVVALACYTIEPNIAAHASLVTTDFGFAAFMFGAVYFLWRTCRRPTSGNAAGFVAFFVLAVVSKFSAVVLVVIAVVLVGLALILRMPIRPRMAAGLMVLAVLVSWLAIWGIYGFRYAPSATPGWLYDFQHDAAVRQQVPTLASLVGWIDAHRLLPNVFSQGFLFGQSKTHLRPAFLNGVVSLQGWWYYFPAAFAMKTSLALQLLMGGGLVAIALGWRRLGRENVLFVVVPIALYLGATMATRINIGVRHLLPIYPFAMLLIAAAAQAILNWRPRAGAVALAAVVAVGAIEFGHTYPDNLAFFNVLAGGPEGGSAHLVDSNLDWGQDLKPLKRWMDENTVPHINLAYFGTAYPPYYSINATMLPGSEFFRPNPNVELPGYVAISATVLRGVYLGDQERAFYRPFLQMTPVATIGHSIFVYWVDHPWWQ